MRVLQICPRQFWPSDTGAKLRTRALARELARVSEVTVVAFAESGSERDPPLEVSSWLASWEIVERPVRFNTINMARSLIGAHPMTVLNYSTRAMEDKIRLVLERARFDAIQIESIHLGVYLRAIRDKAPWARLIMDWHNIESELMARYARFCANPLRSAVAKRTARQLLTMEIEVLQLVDLLFVTSPRELEVVRNGPWHPRCLLQSIENGVTCEDFIDEGSGLTNASETTRRNLIFVGSMDYHANVDAVTWFAHEVWPLVNARFPAVTFKIIGRRPAAAVKQLAMVHGIEVVGEVREVRPFYAAALAAVVPLRTGGGTRLKILEAMAAGVPVVSTRVGAEGLAVEDGRHFLMADSPPALANAIGRIVTDQELGRRLVKQARQLVLERYDWRAIGSGLREAYASLGFLDARRL